MPETIAFEITIGRGKGRESRLAGGLPVDEFNIVPFLRIAGLIV
jgi:hypothetical protein